MRPAREIETPAAMLLVIQEIEEACEYRRVVAISCADVELWQALYDVVRKLRREARGRVAAVTREAAAKAARRKMEE